jgi:hypothetical protein
MMDEETLGDMLRDNGGHMERTCEQVQNTFYMSEKVERTFYRTLCSYAC